MSDAPAAGFMLDVSGRRLKARASKPGAYWVVVADAFPSIEEQDRDLARAKLTLAKRLLPHCVAWEQRVRERRRSSPGGPPA